MGYILVTLEKDYADEFTVFGFKIFTKRQWKSELKKFESITYPCEFYFGTNEMLEFDSFEDVQREFLVQDISKDEYEVFKKYFASEYDGEISFGFIPDASME